MNAGVIIFVLLLVLAFLGLPIYLSIGIATMVAMLHAGFPLEAVAQKTFLGMNSSSLLCIPLFILAGNIMAQGITQKLINAANVPLGRVRGSLASVTVLSSALFRRCFSGKLREKSGKAVDNSVETVEILPFVECFSSYPVLCD